MKYSEINGIRIAEVPAKDFKILLNDGKKKSMGKNRCNAGFFANYSEGKVKFTLPVGHLVCDYAAEAEPTMRYCKERGRFEGNRYRFNSGTWTYQNPLYGKAVSTMVVAGGRASVRVLEHAPSLDECDYAVSGIPIMERGEDVKFATYVRGQGWDASSLYATWHIFVGVKEEQAAVVYVMAMKTTTGNMVTSAEAYKKFKSLGFRDVIKLDGGGSFYYNAAGKTKSTLENRRVCTIIDMGDTDTGGNPYPVPTRALTRGKTGNDVAWLQWELTYHGFPCDIDGSFGPATEKQLKAYQKMHKLEADGSCGPATRAALLA